MKNAYTLLTLLYVVVVFVLLGGWIANLVKVVLVFVHNDVFTTLVIGRIVGVFAAPLGAVLGFF